jgi:iron complex outermembrane recepter protein
MNKSILPRLRSGCSVASRRIQTAVYRLAPATSIRLLALAIAGSLALAATASAAQAPAAAGTGSISGWVSNQATRDLLHGATVELPGLNRTTRTDDTGSYLFRGLPAGVHEIVATYTGLNPLRATVTVPPDVVTRQNFELTSEIYQLGAFTVSAEREGGAAAITMQQNADNVINVVAMDSYGDLPNLSVGELAGLMPGVSITFADDGVVNGIMVRGMSNQLNRVTMDGGLMAGSGLNRAFPPAQYTGAGFEQLELTKGHTPDKGADSLGGTINLKSRSPLSISERRRIDYTVATRYAPPFTKQAFWREQHRAHPLINVGYQEVFDIIGGERNLGIALNAFYSENANGLFVTDRNFENTDSAPAYLWDYRTAEKYNNRKQYSLKFIADYRLSNATKLRFLANYVDSNEPHVRNYITRAFTSQSVGTSGNAGILPGYTERVTAVRPASASRIQLDNRVFSTFRRFGDIGIGAEHDLNRLELDYNAAYSWSRQNNANGKAGGQLITELSNVGWILDRTHSDLYPTFMQTAGPDITDPANYRPAANGLRTRNTDIYEAVGEVRGNARYEMLTAWPLFLKTGFNWREVSIDQTDRNRRYSYTGTTALPHDPSINFRDNRGIPQWEPSMFVQDRQPVSPELWTEDEYFREQTRYTGRQGVKETITAGYLMADGRLAGEGWLGRTSYIAGVRTERTETEGWGHVRARVLSTNAQRLADPVGSAARDYADNRREIGSSYTKSFPSVHLAHDFNRNWKARLSWSTSFGRPHMNNMLPNENPNEANQFVTINNPGLLPQTARNWDATLDYYFRPAGNVSVGWFHKDIRDFIISGIVMGTIAEGPDNGFNGEYGGFELRTSTNGGSATVQGWEFAYQQQFTFLPGLLKGLGLVANYTVLDTHGNFGGATNLTTGQVEGFIPRTGNVILTWRYGRFSSRLRVSYLSDYIANYNANSPGQSIYVASRTLVNPSIAYEVRPYLSLTCDVSNFFHEHQVRYIGTPARMSQNRDNPVTVTFGIRGRF